MCLSHAVKKRFQECLGDAQTAAKEKTPQTGHLKDLMEDSEDELASADLAGFPNSRKPGSAGMREAWRPQGTLSAQPLTRKGGNLQKTARASPHTGLHIRTWRIQAGAKNQKIRIRRWTWNFQAAGNRKPPLTKRRGTRKRYRERLLIQDCIQEPRGSRRGPKKPGNPDPQGGGKPWGQNGSEARSHRKAGEPEKDPESVSADMIVHKNHEDPGGGEET
jgi:hypothetical protein